MNVDAQLQPDKNARKQIKVTMTRGQLDMVLEALVGRCEFLEEFGGASGPERRSLMRLENKLSAQSKLEP